MANKQKIARTTLCVGYQQNGDDYEGGNCGHLQEGQRAFGRSVEMDSMGSESYLLCEACYKAATTERMAEKVLCYDCKQSFTRSQTTAYTPYDEACEREHQRVVLTICNSCQKQEVHLERLRQDKRQMERDLEDLDPTDYEGTW